MLIRRSAPGLCPALLASHGGSPVSPMRGGKPGVRANGSPSARLYGKPKLSIGPEQLTMPKVPMCGESDAGDKNATPWKPLRLRMETLHIPLERRKPNASCAACLPKPPETQPRSSRDHLLR